MRFVPTILLAALCFNCQEPMPWSYPPGDADDGTPGEAPPSSDNPRDETPSDVPDDEAPETRPVDDPDPEPEGDGCVGPGGACECDVDCRGDAAHPGICIHGICGTRASSDDCAPGSSSECPEGQRCWSGTGLGLCYPDYLASDCDGVNDSYGSCVSDGSFDCYTSCGTLCELPGSPDTDTDPDLDPDPEPDPDPDPDPYPEPDPDPDPDPDPGPTGDLTAAELDLFNALNDERAAYGLPPVAVDDRLMCAARNHVLDVGTTGTCGHVGSDGSWPWDRAEACGFPQDTWTVNEIAAGPGFEDGADAVWGWQHSEGHHAAIVHVDAQYVGVGVHNTCFIAVFDCCVASM